jgi:asparagine synthase (glutamine-hydrolysing)
MCGVAGIYAYHYAANGVDRTELRRIRDHMARRGPDGCGEWWSNDGRVGFGHRRLAILDLSERGAQPMSTPDGRLIVTFNGEIYNYRVLRQQLEQKGRRFHSDTDTEVLLHLYDEKGAAMVRELRGMFAFAIWDARRRALFLARDGYGIKPLYYADDGWTFRFASQVKALLAGGQISRDPEPAGWAGFGLYGSVPEPFTTYQDIRAVPAGTTVWVDDAGMRAPQPFFSIAAEYCRAEANRDNATAHANDIRRNLLDSVSHHLVADVPVGAFLSSGIDSGALVGLMRDAGHHEIQTVTLGFDEFRGTRDDEIPIAEQVARRYGTRHTTRIVTKDEFSADLPKILDAMDQPTIDGINTWFVSKAARELGLKVAISGLGGDELFGSYPSFRDVPRWVKLLNVPLRIPGMKELGRDLARALMPGSPKAAGLMKYGGTYAGAYLVRRGVFLPWELDDLIGTDMARIGLRRLDVVGSIRSVLSPDPTTAFGRIATLESSLYMRNQLLRDTDWASMAHSLEVRVPLVDTALLRQLAPSLVGRRVRSKTALAASPSVALPSAAVQRSKTGFSTPIQRWLERDERVQNWREIPNLARAKCSWARRWAYQVAAA